jgi:hypothetical protein
MLGRVWWWGSFAVRHVIALTATAYSLGYTVLILRQLAHRPFEIPDFVTWQQVLLVSIRKLAPAPLVGIVIAILAAYVRRRLTIGSSDRGVSIFGEPRRESMIGINQFLLASTQPRVAQPHR